MKKWKKALLVVLSAVMAATCFGSLIGCKGGNKKLQVWAGSYWGGDNEPIMRSMVEKWNEYARANGKAEAEFSVKQDLRGNMTTGAISGMIGDIIIWDRWESLRLANQEIFIPVDDRLAASGHSVDEFNPAAMSETQYNGKHYGIPFDLDTWGLFVNRKMYLTWAKSVTDPTVKAWLVNDGKTDETTVNTPDSKYNYPSDWDQFYTAAAGCTQKDGNGEITRAGISVDAEFVAWLATAGGAVADVSKGQVVLQSDETIPGTDRTYRQATESVLAFLDKLILQKTDTPEERAQAVTSFTFFSNSGQVDHFLTEKLLFKSNSILNGTAYYNKYKTDDFEFDFIPFPSAPGLNKAGGMLGGYGMAIPKRAPHVDDAWEMVEWWVLNDENYMMWSDVSGLIPTRTALMNQFRADETQMNKRLYLRKAIDCIDNYAVRPPHIAYSLYETSVQTPSLDVYLRRTTQGATEEDDATFHMAEFFKKIEASKNLDTFLGTAG